MIAAATNIRQPRRRTISDGFHDNAGVGAAETEAVAEHCLHFTLLGKMRDQIDALAAFVGIVEIEGRRYDLVAQPSTAPAPPSKWPMADLVELIDMVLRSSPNRRRTAASSIVSAIVEVPCALT